MRDTLDELLETGVNTGQAPGSVVTIVDRNGVTYEGAAGERSIGSGVAMTTDTVGAIMSMTKALTGAAAMQLVEQGRVDLDAPAGMYVSELAEPAMVIEGFGSNGAPITRPAVGDVTLRNLLTHTSGFAYETWNANILKWHDVTGTPGLMTLELDALKAPLAFDPGRRWEYGIGIDWTGILIQRVTGMSLGDYLAEHVTGPLGMADTAFTHTDSMLERASAVHARLPDSSFVAIDLPTPEAPEFEMGGGGLFGTTGDYARFIRMILNDGELDGARVLNADTVAQMVTNNIGDLRVTELKTSVPGFSNDAEMFPGTPKSWGLTFQIHEDADANGCPAGTLSWAGLCNSYYWIDRTNGIGGCYMSQILPFADPGSIDLFYSIQRAVYA